MPSIKKVSSYHSSYAEAFQKALEDGSHQIGYTSAAEALTQSKHFYNYRLAVKKENEQLAEPLYQIRITQIGSSILLWNKNAENFL